MFKFLLFGVSLAFCVLLLIKNIVMELKKQLLQWYNSQLQQKNLFISSLQQLSTGYYFLQVLHNFHPKSVDLPKVYLKPKNQYEVLQNYKLLSSCFIKLGWKKFDPERYSKRREKDYLSLAQILRKILSTRSIKESVLQNNLDTTFQQFKNEEEVKGVPQENQMRSMRIMRLQKTKKQLLEKIMRIQQELYKGDESEEQVLIHNLQKKILQIIEGKDHPN